MLEVLHVRLQSITEEQVNTARLRYTDKMFSVSISLIRPHEVILDNPSVTFPLTFTNISFQMTVCLGESSSRTDGVDLGFSASPDCCHYAR